MIATMNDYAESRHSLGAVRAGIVLAMCHGKERKASLTEFLPDEEQISIEEAMRRLEVRRVAAEVGKGRYTYTNVNRHAELATARAIMKTLRRGTALHSAVRHGAREDEKSAVLRRMRELGVLTDDDYWTSLGRRIHDGWECERCDLWHDHPDAEPYYSANHCNEAGVDLVLCRPCCIKADAERAKTGRAS